jgi:uncharacterized protein (DUF433 family)
VERKGGAPANIDVRTQPAYSLAEAAHHLRLASGTLRSWVVGRPYQTSGGPRTFAPLLKPARKNPTTLSFWNLVEAHVLRALRTDHGVSVEAVRKALRYAEMELGIENLLLRRDLMTDAGRIFLDRYGKLIDLSNSGQLAMRKVLEAHLRRVEWDPGKLPVRLYPFLSPDSASESRLIAIDPQVAFGRPVLQRTGISTQAIAARLDAGETVGDIASDYELTEAEVEQAVLYERAA